jgi:hypothetical protein
MTCVVLALPQAAPVAPANPLSFVQSILGPASPIPTPCLVLKGMFDPAECVYVPPQAPDPETYHFVASHVLRFHPAGHLSVLVCAFESPSKLLHGEEFSGVHLQIITCTWQYVV